MNLFPCQTGRGCSHLVLMADINGANTRVVGIQTECNTLVRQRLDRGQQAYFVYPLVNPSPTVQATAAQEAYRELEAGPLGHYGVGLVHGQMPAEKH